MHPPPDPRLRRYQHGKMISLHSLGRPLRQSCILTGLCAVALVTTWGVHGPLVRVGPSSRSSGFCCSHRRRLRGSHPPLPATGRQRSIVNREPQAQSVARSEAVRRVKSAVRDASQRASCRLQAWDTQWWPARYATASCPRRRSTGIGRSLRTSVPACRDRSSARTESGSR